MPFNFKKIKRKMVGVDFHFSQTAAIEGRYEEKMSETDGEVFDRFISLKNKNHY